MVSELTEHFCLYIDMTTSELKKVCKQIVLNSFISKWDAERENFEKKGYLDFKIKSNMLLGQRTI